jgi:hypothetical protein
MTAHCVKFHIVPTTHSAMLDLIPAKEGEQVSDGKLKSGISGLMTRAKSGDEEAVELLLNFSSLADGNKVAEAAKSALVQLYGAPDTQQGVRQIIAAQACRLFEASQKIGGDRQGTAPARPTVHLKTPILYLAGQHAHEQGQRALESQINDTLQRRCFSEAVRTAPAHERDLLTTGRFVRSEELLGATRAMQSIAVYPHCLELNPPVASTAFEDAVGVMRNAAIQQKNPQAAFVNTGNHWVTLVICPPEAADSEQVGAMIVDTHLSLPAQAEVPVLKKIQSALGDGVVEPVSLRASEMQTHVPNACGPLSIWLIRSLDAYLQETPHAGFSMLQKIVDRFMDDWHQMKPDTQQGMVISARARMLASLKADDALA